MLSETTEEPTSEEAAPEENPSEPSEPPKSEGGTQTEAKDAENKFVATGEGVVSDGKGSTKKVFFLQKKEGPRSQWLKKVSEGLTTAGQTAYSSTTDAISRLAKKSDEKKEAEEMAAEDKAKEPPRFKAIVDAGRESVEKASSRFSGFVASAMQKDEAPDFEEKDSADDQPSRLASFRTLLASRKDHDEVAQLKSQIEDLSVRQFFLASLTFLLSGRRPIPLGAPCKG